MGTIIFLVALAAGLFIGSRFESAHDAHQRFSSYRARTNASLSAWIKKTTVASLAIFALVFLIYFLLFRS